MRTPNPRQPASQKPIEGRLLPIALSPVEPAGGRLPLCVFSRARGQHILMHLSETHSRWLFTPKWDQILARFYWNPLPTGKSSAGEYLAPRLINPLDPAPFKAETNPADANLWLVVGNFWRVIKLFSSPCAGLYFFSRVLKNNSLMQRSTERRKKVLSNPNEN